MGTGKRLLMANLPCGKSLIINRFHFVYIAYAPGQLSEVVTFLLLLDLGFLFNGFIHYSSIKRRIFLGIRDL